MTSLALGLATLGLFALVIALELRDRRRARRPILEGKLLLVNTPKPDDQTLQGVCRAELAGGGLLLEGAVYIDRVPVRGGGEEPREVPAGTVVLPRYSFAQIVGEGRLGDVVDQAVAELEER